MDIAWIGHAAFRLRGRDAAVVLDPCPSSSGFRLGRPQADIVTVSNPAPEHSWVKGVGGDPKPLAAPGEFEIKNVLVTGVVTDPPSESREDRNVAFVDQGHRATLARHAVGDRRADQPTANDQRVESLHPLFPAFSQPHSERWRQHREHGQGDQLHG